MSFCGCLVGFRHADLAGSRFGSQTRDVRWTSQWITLRGLSSARVVSFRLQDVSSDSVPDEQPRAGIMCYGQREIPDENELGKVLVIVDTCKGHNCNDT